jgi:hypothetical protein
MRKPYLNIRCFAHPVILPQLFNRSRAFRLAKVSDQKMFDGLWFGESAKNKKKSIQNSLHDRPNAIQIVQIPSHESVKHI